MQYPVVTLDGSGRVALPEADRLKLGLEPGDLVEFWVAEDGIALCKASCSTSESAPQSSGDASLLDASDVSVSDDDGSPRMRTSGCKSTP